MLVPFCTQDMNDGGITANQTENDVNHAMDLSASNPLSIAGEPDHLESGSVSRSQELPSQNSLESDGML